MIYIYPRCCNLVVFSNIATYLVSLIIYMSRCCRNLVVFSKVAAYGGFNNLNVLPLLGNHVISSKIAKYCVASMRSYHFLLRKIGKPWFPI